MKLPKFMKLKSKILGFPLKTVNLNQYKCKNIIFMGDSAHSIHPMLG